MEKRHIIYPAEKLSHYLYPRKTQPAFNTLYRDPCLQYRGGMMETGAAASARVSPCIQPCTCSHDEHRPQPGKGSGASGLRGEGQGDKTILVCCSP